MSSAASKVPDGEADKGPLPASAPPDQASLHHNRRWLILGIISVAQLMIILSQTIVNIALPSAQQDLGFADANRHWFVTAYALPFGSLLLLGGRMSDLFGRKSAFMIGLAGYATASAVGGAAPSFAVLVSARAAQGVFGALLAPAALALLTTTFPAGRERGKAFGVFGSTASTGAAVGLLLGGALTDYLNWRWCMYINLGFAAVAFVGAAVLLVHQRSQTRPHIDVPGTLTSSAGLFCIVFGFSNAQNHSWGSPQVWGSLVAGAVLLTVFAVLQNRVARPLLPLRVILDRNRSGSLLALLLSGVGMFAIYLFLAFYLQRTLGFSPVVTGLAFLPMVAAILVATICATNVLLPWFGARPVIATGMATTSSALFWLSYLQVDSTYAADVLPPLVVAGVGFGLVIAPAWQTGTLGVLPSDAGVASATVNTMQQLGAALGTSLLSTVAGKAASDYLSDRPSTPIALAESAVHSYTTAFIWASAIYLAGAVICGTVLRPRTPTEPAPPK